MHDANIDTTHAGGESSGLVYLLDMLRRMEKEENAKKIQISTIKEKLCLV
jgi:hypothetical protein